MKTVEYNTSIVSYDAFLTKQWVKELVRKIIDESVHYDIKNNFAKVNIIKDNNQDVKESFFSSLIQLDIVNNGYINNKNIDSYIYYILRNGSVDFVYYGGKYYLKNKSNEHVVNERNFNIELLFNNDSYLLNLYKSWINNSPIKDKLLLGTIDPSVNLEEPADIKKLHVTNTEIVNLISDKIRSIIITTMKYNLKKPNSLIHKLFGRWLKDKFLPYDFSIVLNDRQTIIEDMDVLQNGFNEAFKEAYENAENLTGKELDSE